VPKQTSSRVALSDNYEGQQGHMKRVEEETHPVHLVGDVAQHDGGTNIAAIEDAFTTDSVVLISRVETNRADVFSGKGIVVVSSTVSGNAALVVDARHGAMGRAAWTLTTPQRRLISHPLECLLQRC
jgi:hypothetical protein